MVVEPFALITIINAASDQQTNLRDAEKYLQKNFTNAQDVVVVSAFYGVEFIRDILRTTNSPGNNRTLKLVFAGLPDVARPEQVSALKQMKIDIARAARCSRKNVDIRLAIDARFLHAKVFRFRSKGRLPVYIIGSANFSNSAFRQNDEVMVAIKGRHPGLNDYIQRIVDISRPIDQLPTGLTAQSWRDFLSNGYLYYRPSSSLAWSIEPFADDEFHDIAQRLQNRTFVPLPFSDRSVLGLNLVKMLELEVLENTNVGFKMPTYSIETDYGYWVPKAYVNFIEQKLMESSRPKRSALQERGVALQTAGEDYVRGRIEVYLKDVRDRISGDPPLRLSPDQEEDICKKIIQRVKRLTTLLMDQKSLERLSQAWVGAPVPEFWEDEISVARFFDGFCYDIVTKLNAPKGIPAIVRHIAEQFNVSDDDDEGKCRLRIETFFDQRNSWAENNWPWLQDEEDH